MVLLTEADFSNSISEDPLFFAIEALIAIEREIPIDYSSSIRDDMVGRARNLSREENHI
jgi:hypothetical protein